MKKLIFRKSSVKKSAALFVILCAAICVLPLSCNQKVQENFAEVEIFIGGSGSGGNARSIGSNGLPEISDMQVSAEVEGTTIGVKTLSGSSLSLTLPVGEKITIKVKAENASGIWRGETEHTVREGENRVSVKLKKAAAGLKPLTFSRTVTHDPMGTDHVSFTLKLGGQDVFNREVNNNELPPFCRDNKGRVYLAYQGEYQKTWLQRYTSEGLPDKPQTESDVYVIGLTADPETGAVYAYDNNKRLYMVKDDMTLSTLGEIFDVNDIRVIAAYGNQVFVFGTDTNSPTEQPVVCVYDVVKDGTKLKLGEGKPCFLTNLPDGDITDMLVHGDKLYLIGKNHKTSLSKDPMQSTGFLSVYTYDRNKKELKALKTYGNTPKPSTPPVNNMIKTQEGCFYGACKFIGFDNDVLYIADDGFILEEKNEQPRITATVNRAAEYKPASGTLTFKELSDLNPGENKTTWADEQSTWKAPSTKTLVWTKADPSGINGMNYSLIDENGTPTDFVQSAVDNGYTDVFCYDQDGNFYVVRQNAATYIIEMYGLENGSYTGTNLGFMDISFQPTAIAVDISGSIKDSNGTPQKALYMIAEQKVERYLFDISVALPAASASADPDYKIEADHNNRESFTALAANKDGVFVAVKTGQKDSNLKYDIKVKKYSHNAENISAPLGSVPISEGKTGEFNPGSPPKLIWSLNEVLNALHIQDGVLYGLTTKEFRNDYDSGNFPQKASISGKLLKIGTSTAKFADSAVQLHTLEPKDIHKATDEQRKEGGTFAPYRFIAVMPEKLVIASDGFWGWTKENKREGKEFNFVWLVDINKDGSIKTGSSDKEENITFSKSIGTYPSSTFDWD